MNTPRRFSLDEKHIARFWSKVALPDENGCMLWLAAIDARGYGNLRVDRRNRKAHRASLILAVGQPPSLGHEAAHSCRNRHCVAPSHLRWATRAENIADKLRDGTDQFGTRNSRAVLSEAQVISVRKRYAQGGVLQRELAEEFGVSRSTIGLIITGKNWPHLHHHTTALVPTQYGLDEADVIEAAGIKVTVRRPLR